jgi:predicted dehydrogenase
MSAPLRIGLAGGNFGLRVLAPALRGAGFEITAFASRDVATARRLADAHGIPVACAGVDALLEERLDAVALALPPSACAAAAAAAIARGIPVFAEKPLAPDAAAAQALVQAAAARNLPCVVDFEFPELLPFQALRAAVTDGTLGDVHHVQVTWLARGAAAAGGPAWKADMAAGGGLMGLYGVHILHAAEWFYGPIAAIAAQPAPPEGMATILAWRWESGAAAAAVLTMAASGPNLQRWEVSGSRGQAVLENATSGTLAGFRLRLHGPDGSVMALCDDAEAAAGGIVVPVTRLARRFAASLRGGPPPVPDLAAAHRALLLAETARRAAPLPPVS